MDHEPPADRPESAPRPLRPGRPALLVAVALAAAGLGWALAGGTAAAQEPRTADAPVRPATGTRGPAAQPSRPAPHPSVLASFDAGPVRGWIETLASPAYGGRASGTPGCDSAGRLIESTLRAWGIEPAGEDGGFRQAFAVRMLPFPKQGRSANPTGGSRATFNVCGIVRGSDPALAHETIVLTAHYDHVGRADAERVYGGADDNASGVAALLLVARAFAAQGAPRPRRSVLFLFTSGEERGLLGAARWVSRPTVPLADVVANLNLDMVGRNEADVVHTYGNASSPHLDAAHLRAAERSGLRFSALTGSVFKRSDHALFYEAGVPCLYLTSGLHRDYHTVDDTADKVDAGKVARVALHTYLTAWDVAHAGRRPQFTRMGPDAAAGPFEAVLAMLPRGAAPAWLDVPAGGGVVLVMSPFAEGLAARHGIVPGTFVTAAGGRALSADNPVLALERAIDASRSRDGPGRLTIRVQRGRKARDVELTTR